MAVQDPEWLVVEDGTGLPNANSYVSLDTAQTYFLPRTGDWTGSGTDDDRARALVRATSYIDPTYRSRFPGFQLVGRAQSLEWPRSGAYVVVPDDGRSDAFYYGNSRDYLYVGGVYYVAPNVVPREVVAATCEAALRELLSPNSLQPDQTRDDIVKSFKAGPVSVTYDSSSPTNTVFQTVDNALVSLLLPRNSYSGRVTRR